MASVFRIFHCGVIFSFFILSGCKKEESPDPLECLNCEFSALLEDTLWDASITKCVGAIPDVPTGNETFGIYILENKPHDDFADELWITGIPSYPGRYTLVYEPHFHLATSYFHIYIPGSISRLQYVVADSSYVEVDFVNFETREWQISFHLHMRSTSGSGLDIYPEEFTISEGFAKGEFPE